MKYFSTFSGIGGFEIGIHNAWLSAKERSDNGGGQPLSNLRNGYGRRTNPTCVGYSEIDKYATQVYETNFKGVPNYGDITKIKAEELPDFDILVGGFPCQSFSIAGKRAGFADTRGTLFFDLARILRAKRPKLFVFENVKGLLSHDGGQTFATIIEAIDELGYDCQWQVLNSKNHGVPQNRERIYIVGHLRGQPRPEVFPIGGGNEEDSRLSGHISNTITARYEAGGTGTYVGESEPDAQKVKVGTLRTHKDGEGFREIKSGVAPTIPARARQDGSGQPVILTSHPIFGKGKRSVEYKTSDEVPTIRATHYKNGDNQPKVLVPEATKKGYAEATVGQAINLNQPNSKTRRGRVSDVSPTLDTGMSIHTLTPDVRIRRLTPIECERLQGFPDDWTKFNADGEQISDTQRYKMCGNAVTTNVVQAVFERIF